MDITPQGTNLSVKMENVSLDKQDPENETGKFGHCLLGPTTINQMMKCDRRG